MKIRILALGAIAAACAFAQIVTIENESMPTARLKINSNFTYVDTQLGLKLTDPTTTNGDIIVRLSGVISRLAVGTNGNCLVVASGAPAWGSCPSGGGGMTDPMTTTGDLIYRSTGGTTRLGVGSNGQCMIVSGGIPTWGSCPAGFSDPMTTTGDLIYRSSGGTTRIGVGSNGQCMIVSGGIPTWGTCPAGTGAVSSVFGRTGAVTAATGDYTPDQVGALPDDFTIVGIPDPHVNQTQGPAGATAMGVWLAANKAAWNIKMAVSVGDFTGINNDSIRTSNLNTAFSSIFTPLDTAGIPWIPTPGNHDYDGDSPVGRRTTIYDALISYTKISGKSWYGDYWHSDPNGDKANQYIKVNVGSLKFLVIALEFFPRSGAVAWAQGVIAANPTYQVIITTHGLQKFDGTFALDADTWGPNAYSLPSIDYNGQEIVTAFKDYPNLIAIMDGHYLGGGSTARTSAFTQRSTVTGKMINFLFADFQEETDTSWLALYKFRPSAGTIEVYYVRTSDGVYYSSNPVYSLPWDSTAADAIHALPTGIGSRRDVVQFPAGVCQGGTPSTGFGYLSATAPAAAECTGTVNPQGVQPLAATKAIYHHFILPVGWVRGSMQADIAWRSSSTTGNAIFNINGACVAAGSVTDPTLSSTADTVTAATGGTANILTVSTVDLYNAQAACAAGQEFYFSITGGSHTVGSDPRLQWVTFRYAR